MGSEDAVCGSHYTACPDIKGAPDAPDTGAQGWRRRNVPVGCPEGEGAANETTTGRDSRAEDEVEKWRGDEEGVDGRDGEERKGVEHAVGAEEAVEGEEKCVCEECIGLSEIRALIKERTQNIRWGGSGRAQ